MITYIVDTNEVTRLLNEAGRHIANSHELMTSIANVMYSGTVKHFEDEAYEGHKWPPLKPRTAQARITKTKRRGYENILRPTGRHIFQRLYQDSTRDEARVGCAMWWAWVHQLGAKIGNARIPARPFLGLDSSIVNSIAELLRAWLSKVR